ncbi:MAG: hypothetical protein HW394_641 [Acidobacteria bacterium]|nr:hypothetical protein [Acidobacteriota bacterium]
MDSSSRPAMLLVSGRSIGFAASFAIGIVLARLFDPAVFGTYKQFFLLYATLYGVLQLGMAESLYYFVPRRSQHTGRYVCNAMVMLAAAGLACTFALYVARTAIAGWLSPELAEHLVPLGLFLTFTLASTVLEIVMVSRGEHMTAAVTYALSDIVRTLLFIIPALAFASVRAVFVGATVFAGLRLLATVATLWREFGRDFRIDLSLWRQQLAYALPFALAVGIEVVLINYHQYVVAARFDAATFAIYAIGCMQIPLVDLIATSTVNVLMVRMADGERGRPALALWHDTVGRLAFLLFPLAVFLVISARYLIVGLFTATYAASVPIFMISALTMLPAVTACGDGGGCGPPGLRADAFSARHESRPLRVRGRADRLVPVDVRPGRRGAGDTAGDDGGESAWRRPHRTADARGTSRGVAVGPPGPHRGAGRRVGGAGPLAPAAGRMAPACDARDRRRGIRSDVCAAELRARSRFSGARVLRCLGSGSWVHGFGGSWVVHGFLGSLGRSGGSESSS